MNRGFFICIKDSGTSIAAVAPSSDVSGVGGAEPSWYVREPEACIAERVL